MSAGELKHQITFQVQRNTYGTRNEQIPVWVDLVTVWASIITSGGREFFAAQRMNAETTAVFKIRHNAVINSRMRIKYGNRYFEIIAPPNDIDERHEYMLVNAKEVV